MCRYYVIILTLGALSFTGCSTRNKKNETGTAKTIRNTNLFIPNADTINIPMVMANILSVTEAHHLYHFLDGGENKLIVTNKRGSIVQILGGMGKSDTEFYKPSTLQIVADTLYVLEFGNARVSKYIYSSGKYELSSTVRTIIPFENMLVDRNGRIYLIGIYNGKVIHLIENSGSIVKSFGVPYKHPKYPSATFSYFYTKGKAVNVSNYIIYQPMIPNKISLFSSGELVSDKYLKPVFRDPVVKIGEKGRHIPSVHFDRNYSLVKGGNNVIFSGSYLEDGGKHLIHVFASTNGDLSLIGSFYMDVPLYGLSEGGTKMFSLVLGKDDTDLLLLSLPGDILDSITKYLKHDESP